MSVFCRLLAVLVLFASSAFAQDSNGRYDFHIEHCTLGVALDQFVELTGARLIYPERLANEDGVNPVIGQYTVKEALVALLNDTEFSGGLTRGGVIVISLKKSAKLENRGATVSKHKLKGTLLGGVAALFSAGGVFAQDPANQDSATDNTDRVVVTGSRVARSGFDTPTPTTVISSDQIMQTGLVDTGSIIMQNPQISVGLGSSNDTFNRDIGSSFINLRGLGENRTLVLVDGRRRVSGSREGSQVDLSSIPPGMIESIEIITGGASAVYGADAVSGVVNVKLKKDFEGLEATVRGGISQEGDAETYSAYLNGGGQFAGGRGYASFGISAQESKVLKYTDRDYASGDGAVTFVNNPANTGPDDGIPDRLIISDPHSVSISYEPTFVIGGDRYFYDGGVVALDNPDCYGNSCSGGPYGYNNKERNLRTPRTVFSAISNVSYEVAPSVRIVAGVDFSFAETQTNGQSFFDSGIVLDRDNPTIPAEVLALMGGAPTLTIGTQQEDRLGNKQYDNSRYTFTTNVGFEGEIADRFNWEAFYQYGRRTQNYSIAGTRIESRYFQALDAVSDGMGGAMCADPAAVAAGCVPLDFFTGGMIPEADQAYYSYTLSRKVDNEQAVAGFQITGPLLELPAGPLSVALGAEYRQDKLSALDDGLAARGELYRTDNGAQPVKASTDVKEAFIEAVAPILEGAFLAESLEIEGAMRFSDYSSIGSTLAWKLGGAWAPSEDVRIRVTRSKSVRAPNIIELFGPESRGTLNIDNDPCDASQINLVPNREANCRAFGVPVGWTDPAATLALQTVIGGNESLTEETSNSWTIGGVITPRFVPGLRLSADYWTIEIEDAIQTLDGNKIVENCVDSPSIDNVFCDLVTRGNFPGLADPSVVSQIDLRQVNIGRLSAKGIDFSAAYGLELEDVVGSLSGGLNFNLSLVYLMELEELVDVTDPTSLLIEDGEYDDPTWRGRFSASYNINDLTVVWNMRYVGSAEIDVQRTREYNVEGVPSRLYHDLFIGYELPNQGLTLQVGINNLLNTNPPRLPGIYAGTFDGSHYENVGRNFFLGVTKSF
ncbi:TonB-dependent receptor plug domain-containing protein [Hyphococcus lacteus]|uniref:TonB-dependent receptor n=1 Tax=Hyphococcus lacteus TaxID=3143536 RepID=A0ABV3Z7M5_9PROT